MLPQEQTVATGGEGFGLLMRFSGGWRLKALRPFATTFFQSLSIESTRNRQWSFAIRTTHEVRVGRFPEF
jgi:hypothetical protein